MHSEMKLTLNDCSLEKEPDGHTSELLDAEWDDTG